MEWKHIYKHYRLLMARSEINTKYGQHSTTYLLDSHSLAILVCNPFYKTRWCDYIHVSSCKMHCSLSGISVHNNPIHILKKIKISLEKTCLICCNFCLFFSFVFALKWQKDGILRPKNMPSNTFCTLVSSETRLASTYAWSVGMHTRFRI